MSAMATRARPLLTVGAIVLLLLLGDCGELEAPATSTELTGTVTATPVTPTPDVEPADSVAPAVDSPMPAAEPVEAVEPTPQPPTVEELNQRLVAWEAGLLQDYRIVYQEIGSASREQSAPVIITVRNGSVASVVYRSNGQPAPLRSYPNVEHSLRWWRMPCPVTTRSSRWPLTLSWDIPLLSPWRQTGPARQRPGLRQRCSRIRQAGRPPPMAHLPRPDSNRGVALG